MQSVHLDSSLTFIPPTMLRQRPGDVIDVSVFADADQHIILRDSELASCLREFAMREGMALAKVPVGSKDENTPVEFFWMDVKRSKKEVGRLAKLIGRRWVLAMYEVELARDENDGNFLSPAVTPAMSALENLVEVRRFLANGIDPSMLSKKKRSVLLFHHTLANAPQAE